MGRDPYPVYKAHQAAGTLPFLPTQPGNICPVDDIGNDPHRAIVSSLLHPFHSWTIHIGDWWGELSSRDIPGPYELVTPSRWGPDELRSMGPRFRFVSMVRDGRDQIESLRHFKGAYEQEKNKRDPEEYFRVLCKGFRNRARLALDCQKKLKSYRMFRFEELVKDPVTGVCRMFDHLGLKPDLDALKKNLALTHSNRGLDHSSFSSVESYCRWKNWSENEKNIFKETAGTELIEMGYEMDQNW